MINSCLPTSQPPELEIRQLSKRFGSVIALEEVSLTLKPGTIHALLGENGAGKSTLVKCVMGFYHGDRGQILLNQQPCKIANPRAAQKYGIGMVYQHFTVFPAMTVAENLVISRNDTPNFINWSREFEKINKFLENAPFSLPLEAKVADLAAGQKQKLEILKQLYLHNTILILDEPTSVLTPQEAIEVLGLLRQEVTKGALSILLITHKFKEVTNFADEVSVLRQGRLVGSGKVQDLGVDKLATMMLGESRSLGVNIGNFQSDLMANQQLTNQKILEINDLKAENDQGVLALNGINLTVNQGEIVGIAGVSGNGQKELIEVLGGQRFSLSGAILLNGKPERRSRSQITENQVFILPSEPLDNACVPQMSVAENLALRTFDRPPQVKGYLFVIWSAIRQFALNLIERFGIITPSPETSIEDLSGGNIQRTVIGRELASAKIKLLIAANPCFGLDFAATDYVYQQILAARARGVGILLISEDLDELLTLSDRLLVISGGQLVYETTREQADLVKIGQAMAGH